MAIDPRWLEEHFPSLADFRPISRGGQKWVYRVRDQDSKDEYVLKIYFPGSNPERAFREVRAAKMLEHPSIPAHVDLGKAPSALGPVIWVLEELVVGRSLKDILAHRVATDDELYGWTYRLLDILREGEAKNIFHRDVKPGNIMIDETNNAWLLDFGLARHVDLESITATEAQEGVGTPGYAPPEQLLNLKGQIDGRADLFGLGVTMYECATGENPYREGAKTREEVFERVLTRQLPELDRKVQGSGKYAQLLLAMTRRELEHRAPSVEFAHEWMSDLVVGL